MKKNSIRVICGILAVVMVLLQCGGLLPAGANAAPAYTAKLTDAEGNNVITAKPGDTVTLVLSIENNPGVIGVGVEMTYPAGITLTERPQNVSAFKNVADGYFICSQELTVNPYLMWWNYALGDYNKKLLTENGAMAQITFKITDNAQNGDYAITLSAPADKNTTASTDGSGVILDYTNAPINLATVGCTIRVENVCNHSFGPWTDVVGDEPSCTEGGSQIRACSLCDEEETMNVGALGHNYDSGSCTRCGIPFQSIPGDINVDGLVTRADVIDLLLHVTLPNRYPIQVDADFNSDDIVTRADVIKLLLFVTLPSRYPLT